MPLVRIHKAASAARENASERKVEKGYRDAIARLVIALRSRARLPRFKSMLAAHLTPARVAAFLIPDKEDLFDDAAWHVFARDLESPYWRSLEGGLARGISEAGLEDKIRLPMRKGIEAPPNPYSVKWAKERGSTLITGISKQQRELIRGVVSDCYEKGKRPDVMAEAIRSIVGLNDVQAGAVERRRDAMIEGGADEAAADAGAMRYSNKLVELRADTIARTENKAAAEQGRVDSWKVAQDQNLLPKDAKKRWTSMPESPRLSDICRELDGQVVEIDEPFHSDELEEDLDGPPAHPNCRSTLTLVFDEPA